MIAAATLIALAWGWYLYVHAFVPEGDTQLLVSGSRTAWACIQERRVPCDGVAQFAILQNIPALIGVALGKTDTTIYRVLSLGSILAIAGLTVLSGLIGRRVTGSAGAALGAAVVLSGPFVFYDATTWGEPVAALFLSLPVALLIFRFNVVLLAVAAALAAITKDVAPVTVVLLAAAILAARFGTDGRSMTIRRAVAVAAGCAVGAGATAAFNYFRYGVFHNAFYIDQVPRPPLGGFTIKAFGALWFSPSGGVIPYWPSMVVLLVVIGMSLLAIRAASWPMRLAHVAFLGACIFNTAVLAGFVAPFGWIAWGPRLMLPWLLPALFIGAVLHRRTLDRWCATCMRAWGIFIPIAVAAVVSGIYVNAAARFSDGWVAFFRPRPTTDPYCGTSMSWDQPDAYFSCIGSLLWDRNGPIILLREGVPPIASDAAMVLAFTVATFLIAALGWVIRSKRFAQR